MEFFETLRKAREAKIYMGQIPHSIRQEFLRECAKELESQCKMILEANQKDLSKAKEFGLSASMLERLTLNQDRILAMVKSLKEIADFPDPLNKILGGFSNSKGLEIEKVSVPIGVIGIIYESRPNVTSDTAALCFKSGNVCVLRGGKEAQNSNKAIVEIFHRVLEKFKIPKEVIIFLSCEREELKELLGAREYIDLVIPRGGEGLIKFVSEHSKIPVIKQDKGVCHIFAHLSCRVEQSIAVIVNAKTSRPSVCNACETLLVDSGFAKKFLPKVAKALKQEETILKGCKESCEILAENGIECEEIPLESYHIEYNENILNLRIVQGLQGALEHIREFSSGHSEAILCEDYSVAEDFLNQVDSACVYVNASTRFSDGGEFGYGAEVGISTSKLHARGPMGVECLTSYKYKIRGNGQIR